MAGNLTFERADIVSWARAYTGPKFHGVLCDPPYELGFMGKHWDSSGIAFQPDTWAAVSDCLVPGAHLLAFGGTRTFHRLACAIEDAGFEIRDTCMYVYGSGFPKSLDVSKAIDKAAGAEREVVGQTVRQSAQGVPRSVKNGTRHAFVGGATTEVVKPITAPATDAAHAWSGYGTALKPAWEPVIVARKPLDGTVADNCQRYGAGALNIDASRISTNGDRPHIERRNDKALDGDVYGSGINGSRSLGTFSAGRWPANLIHDGSDEIPLNGASRFFYTAKASRAERDAGLEGFEAVHRANGNKWTDTDYRVASGERTPGRESGPRRNAHPTVKPLSLCEYLARLILPPPVVQPRRILVPFAGTGSEAIGAMRAGWDEVTGVEMEQEYVDIAVARAKYWQGEMICLTT